MWLEKFKLNIWFFVRPHSISFLEETTPVDVGVCYTEASRVCDKEDLQKRKRSMGDFEFEVKETCMEVLETGKYKAPNAINLT